MTQCSLPLNKIQKNEIHSLNVGSGSEEDDFEDALDYQEKITIPSPVQQPNHRYTAATALIINSFH